MGMDVVLGRAVADPGDRDADAQPSGRYRRRHLCLAQPFADNGIKLFGPDGYKLSDEFEGKIEASLGKGPKRRAGPLELGRAKRLDDAAGRYIEFVKQSFPKGCGSTACALSSIARTAPPTRSRRPYSGNSAPRYSRSRWRRRAQHQPRMRRAGTEQMRHEVLARPCRYRIALDGDADRLIMADEHGVILDGDPADGTDRDKPGARRASHRRRAGRDGNVQSRPRTLSDRAGIGLRIFSTT